MPCYKAKSTHLSTTDNQPGIGPNWMQYWMLCPCCSSATATSSSGTTTTQSSAGAAFVLGMVPDWNQPMYYEQQAVIAGTPISSPAAESSNYLNMNANALKAWCAPAAAACQLGHLQHHATVLIDEPQFVGDNVDAGSDTNPSLQTISWDSAPGWGDFMVDGPMWRGKMGSPASINGCRQTDFGWWMDTNGAGNVGSQSYIGTTLAKVYDGLVKFYDWVGYTNFIGMAYHLPRNGSTLTTMGQMPYSSNSNADMTQTWLAIKNEIQNNRTVVATTMGYEITSVTSAMTLTVPNTQETEGIFYTLGAGNTNQPITPMVDGQEVQNGEQYNWEVYDANGIGHTVLIVGYIEAGSTNDIAPTSLSQPATNWVIIRDNFEQSHRNVILPFDRALTGARSFWDALLSTCYVNPAIASYSSQCVASSSSSTTSSSNMAGGNSSSSSSSASAGGGSSNIIYMAYPCQGNDWDAATNCNTWYSLSGGIPIQVSAANDSSPNYTCTQDNSTVLTYKIARVNGVSALGSGFGDCTLLILDSTATPLYTATSITDSNQSCYNCDLSIVSAD